jgi:hypothetical protein
MDPYEFARQQGQTIGSKPGQPGEEPLDDEDLMYLLFSAYVAAGHLPEQDNDKFHAVSHFCEFSNNYLARRRVVSTGVVNGEFSLVFEDGVAVPLATTEPATAARPDPTIPITRPQDSKMKGMPVVDSSVPVTTGTVGSPVRRPK